MHPFSSNFRDPLEGSSNDYLKLAWSTRFGRPTILFLNEICSQANIGHFRDATCHSMIGPCGAHYYSHLYVDVSSLSLCTNMWHSLGGATWHRLGLPHGTFLLVHMDL